MRDLHPIMLEERIYKLEQGGGGSGTTDYEDLENKPKIENVELVGNRTFEELGIASAEDLAQTNEDLIDITQNVNQNTNDIGELKQDLIDVEENLTKLKSPFIDTDNLIATYSSATEFDAAEDCYILARVTSAGYSQSGNSFMVEVNGVNLIGFSYKLENGLTFRDSCYVKKGQHVKISGTKQNWSTIDVNVYGLLS